MPSTWTTPSKLCLQGPRSDTTGGHARSAKIILSPFDANDDVGRFNMTLCTRTLAALRTGIRRIHLFS